jgi:L-methionine (R)-S-oxide reductase
MTDYTLLNAQLEALLEDEPNDTANLANAAALLFSQLEGLNWAGFYFVGPARPGSKLAAPGDHATELVLGPFQGLPACIRLPHNQGVCGTAWAQNRTLVVTDVHEFPGHIACDSASQSEIVVPLRHQGKVIGVLDLDSPQKGRFTDDDRRGLEAFCVLLETRLRWNRGLG